MKYFLYRHIRLDNYEPFYIGIGSNLSNSKYNRAYSKSRRSMFWSNVADKTTYKVEILYECNNRKEICNKEKYFINLYGRRDLKSGNLVNLTSGGDANFKMSKQSIESGLVKRTQSGHYDKISKMMSSKMLGNSYGTIRKGRIVGKSIFVYKSNGEFYKKFNTISQCFDEMRFTRKRIMECIKRDGTYKGYRFFFKYIGNNIDFKECNIIKNKRKVLLVESNIEFDSITLAAKHIGVSVSGIRNSIVEKRKCKKLTFIFI